jgi:hypothetical protein
VSAGFNLYSPTDRLASAGRPPFTRDWRFSKAASASARRAVYEFPVSSRCGVLCRGGAPAPAPAPPPALTPPVLGVDALIERKNLMASGQPATPPTSGCMPPVGKDGTPVVSGRGIALVRSGQLGGGFPACSFMYSPFARP